MLAAPYVGRWKVIQRDLPEYDLEFPALWIEFTQTLELEAADSRWVFELDGDILTLTTPNWFDRQEPAVVVLQREATE